jgi:tetratricopeptide (TPR) repeat protein
MGIIFLWGSVRTPAAEGSQWICVHSKHFELLTSAGKTKAYDLISYLELVREFFLATTRAPERDPSVVNVLGFSNAREFRPYQLSRFSKAYYTGGNLGDFIVMGDISPESYPTAVHEYVHLLIRRSGFQAPAWWHEGLADLYSTLRISGGKIEVGEAIPSRLSMLSKKKSWIDLTQLLSADQHSPLYQNEKTAEMLYSQSWALVHMLCLSDGYRPKFLDLLKALPEKKPAEELFRTVYGKNLLDLKNDLENYIQRGNLGRAVFPVQLEIAAMDIAFVPETEVRLQTTLAKVLLGIGRQTESSEILDRLAKTYPGNWEMEEARAYLEWYSGDRVSACAHFASAESMGMSRYQSLLDYAALLTETGAPPAAAIRVLEKAIQLAPQGDEAAVRLASLYLGERRYAGVLSILENLGPARPEEAFPVSSMLAREQSKIGTFQAPDAASAKDQASTRPDAKQEEIALISRATLQPNQTMPALDSEIPPPDIPQAKSLENRRMPLTGSAEISPFSAAAAYKIRGKLRQIDCQGKGLKLILEVSGKLVALSIPNPNAVEIRGNQNEQVVFYCGIQKNESVSITYEPKSDSKTGTAGIIRALVFD